MHRLWHLWCSIAGVVLLVEVALGIVALLTWPIGQWRERRQARRLDSDIAEFERQYRERSGG